MDVVLNGMHHMMDEIHVMMMLVLVKNVMRFRKKFETHVYLDLIGLEVLIMRQSGIQKLIVLRS